MENIRKRQRVDFVTSREKCESEHPKLCFKDSKNQTNSGHPFSVFEYDKRQMTFEKSFHLGFIILDISKMLMYEYYYDILQHFSQKDNYV